MSGQSNEKTRVLQHNPDKHNKPGAKIDNEAHEGTPYMYDVESILKECEDGQATKEQRNRRHRAQAHSQEKKDDLAACEPPSTAQGTEGKLTQEDIDDWLNMFKPVEVNREKQQPQWNEQAKSTKKKKKRKRPQRDRNTGDEAPAPVEINYEVPARPVRESERKRGSGCGMTLKITRHSNDGDVRKDITFLDLPRELRDMVYELCVPDVSGITTNARNQLKGYYDGMAKINQMRQQNKVRHLIQRLAMRHGQLETPSVLLLNRQIHEEAILYLRKQTITFDSPAIICDELPISQLVSHGLLRSVKAIHFEMPMKQHTHATMLGEMQMGYNWWSKSSMAYESLNHAQPWGFFLSNIASILQEPGHRIQQVTFSVTNGSFGRKNYVLEPHSGNMTELAKTVHACLRSRNLDRFLRHLQLAATSYTEQPNDSNATSDNKDVSDDASNVQTNP